MISKLAKLDTEAVSEILQKDRDFRKVGMKDDLFLLEQLHPTPWSYSELTIELDPEIPLNSDEDVPAPGSPFPKPADWQLQYVNTASFRSAFYEQYPFMKKLFQKEGENLLLAGGSVSNMLSGYDPQSVGKQDDPDSYRPHYRMGDLDLFFYGLDPTEASAKLERVLKILRAEDNGSHYYENDDIDLYNNRNCVCLAIRTKEPIDGADYQWQMKRKIYEIQIIMRLYQSPSEILHGFDLGSSAVGFDGQKVYFTSLSKFCYNHGVNLIDPTRRSPSYEYRNFKYLKRGFKLVFPYLDLTKVKAGETVSLPHMEFTPSRIQGNRILLKSFKRVGEYQGPISDYSSKRYPFSPYRSRNLYELRKLEMKHLMEDEARNRIHCHEGIQSLINGQSCLNEGYIRGNFDHYYRKIRDGSLPEIQKMNAFLGDEKYEQVIYKALIQKPRDHDGIKAIFDEVVQFIIARWKESYPGLVWITENPGGDQTSLQGSFNPKIETDEQYYGEFYHPKMVKKHPQGWFNW